MNQIVEKKIELSRGVAIDITERQKAEEEREKAVQEEAEAANRMKDEFLATLSHELRTPYFIW